MCYYHLCVQPQAEVLGVTTMVTKFEVGKKYRYKHSPDDDFYIEILHVGKEQVFYVDREGGEGCTYLVGADNYEKFLDYPHFELI